MNFVLKEGMKIKMEENQEVKNETEQSSRTENLKKETASVINEAKEQMKNINIKEEAEKGKGLIKNLWKEPIKTIKEIAQDEENKTFKTALFIIAIWVIAVLLRNIMFYATSKYYSFNFLDTLKVTITPILKILVMVGAIYFVNKNAKKSVSRIITSVSIAKIPAVITSVLSFLTLISSKMSYILSPISSVLSIISMILMFFTVKFITEEEDDTEAFKKFVLVQGIYYIAYFVINFLDISI